MVEMGAINLVIVDSDVERREWLIGCLSHEAGLSVVGAGDNFLDACHLPVQQRAPIDVLLINIDRPKIAAMENWAEIRFLLPNARIAALTEGMDDSSLMAALGAGVTALHRLDVEADILKQAVRNAAQGAVDYDPDLIERAKRVLLRPLEETQVRFGGLTIDLETQEVTRWGRSIPLTPLEFQALAYLARNRGRPISSVELLEAVWHTPTRKGGTTAQVKNCIKRLRQKIEPDARHSRYIQSRRGWGYMLRDPSEQAPD